MQINLNFQRIVKNLHYSLVIFSIIFATLNFLPIHLEKMLEPSDRQPYDSFDTKLAEQITSIESLETYIDNKIRPGVSSSTLEYWNTVSETLRHRFYHGFSKYSLSENWLAAIIGYLFEKEGIQFQSLVLPEEIMKYPLAACSQQGIILQTLFKNKGINYKTVIFRHHYAVAAEIETKWYFFDTNMEPVFINGQHPTIDKIQNLAYLEKIYPQFSPESVAFTLNTPVLSDINPPLAPKMVKFQLLTETLSRTIWIPFLLCFIVIEWNILSFRTSFTPKYELPKFWKHRVPILQKLSSNIVDSKKLHTSLTRALYNLRE